MINSFELLCSNAIVDMHSLVASRLINIQEIDASQDYCLQRGLLLDGPFNGFDTIDSCVAIALMQFSLICAGLFNSHNAINVINGWVSPVIRQLRQPNPSEYSHADPQLAIFLLKQLSLIPTEVILCSSSLVLYPYSQPLSCVPGVYVSNSIAT